MASIGLDERKLAACLEEISEKVAAAKCCCNNILVQMDTNKKKCEGLPIAEKLLTEAIESSNAVDEVVKQWKLAEEFFETKIKEFRRAGEVD